MSTARFAHSTWWALTIISGGIVVALVGVMLARPTGVSAAGQTQQPTLTDHPQIANARNHYNNALVANKLLRLHTRVSANINYSYITSTAWPVLFVHGFNSHASIDCKNSYWGGATSFLRTEGWSGSLVTLGYYSGDHNCDVALSSYAADCTSEYAGNQGTTNEDLRHVACELAWYIWYHYTQYGQNVQLVGHSMGGLLIRWALYDTPIDFYLPPYLMVQDAVTMATPHGGIPIVGAAIFLCGNCWQGNQMRTNNAFWETLNTYGQNPQGAGWGTDWTLMGSSCESFYNIFDPGVSWQSALDMDGGHKTEYLNPPCYDHGAYLTDTSTNDIAHADYCTGCKRDVLYYATNYWPHSLYNMYFALQYSTW